MFHFLFQPFQNKKENWQAWWITNSNAIINQRMSSWRILNQSNQRRMFNKSMNKLANLLTRKLSIPSAWAARFYGGEFPPFGGEKFKRIIFCLIFPFKKKRAKNGEVSFLNCHLSKHIVRASSQYIKGFW